MDMKILNKFFLLLTVIGGFISCNGDEQFDPDKSYVLLTGTDVNSLATFQLDDTPSIHYVTTSVTRKVSENIVVEYGIDNAALEAYNQQNKTSYYPIPEASVKLLDVRDTITAGKAASSGIRVQVVSTENWVDGRSYVIPVSIQHVSNDKLEILESAKTVFLKVSRKLNHSSLDISNSNLYSEYWFEESKENFTPIDLPQYTCEIKVFLTEDRPNRIRRLCNWGGEGGQNMLRFGEAGMDRNQLQWVSPGGSVPSKALFAPNRWYTVSLTFDGSKYVMYVDGVKDSEVIGSSSGFKFSKFEIGMSWAGYTTQQRTSGRIAEVKLWNKALVASEIQMGMCGVDPQTPGLVAYWKMNEDSGHVFHDATGNGYDMDWSDTWRSPTESDIYQQYDKSSFVNWVKDENNACYQ